jgi:hypothetical protein
MGALQVVVMSPEQAEHGVAEIWADGTLFGFTRLEEGELRLRIQPREDGGVIVISAHTLTSALARANELLASM